MSLMRNGSLDLVRLPAAFGVVLFHIHAPGAELGYSGLAYFLILVPALGLPSSALASRVGFMRARARFDGQRRSYGHSQALQRDSGCV